MKPKKNADQAPKSTDAPQVHTRLVYWAGRVDWNTFKVYIRQKKVRGSIAERHLASLSPAGNIYGKTEGDVLTAIHVLLQDHIAKARLLEKSLAGNTVDVVDLDNAVSGGLIELPWDEKDEASPEDQAADEKKSSPGRRKRRA